jgi:hypothetical protein
MPGLKPVYDRPQAFHIKTLKNGEDRQLNVSPGKDKASAFITVPGEDATAKVTDQTLADVSVKKLSAQDGKSRFEISWRDPEVDSGWNGGTVKFNANDYAATIDLGMFVDD